MIPKILHQTARTRQISWEERHLVRRAARLLPGWDLRLWDDANNEALIVRHFPEHAHAYRAIKRGVMKADIARLAYMHVHGGVYMDTDYKLLRPLGDALMQTRCLFGLEVGTMRDGRLTADQPFRVGNAFFAAAQGYPLFGDMIRHIFAQVLDGRMTEYELMKISGPHGLSRFLRDHEGRYPDVTVKDQSVFFPDAKAKGLLHHIDQGTIGIHLCWGSWRDKRVSVTIRNRMRRIAGALI
ncbi:Glycosyltransferase sugar-binding region containing DXD motif-containing protein [Sphingomonas sp. OV641]|uniref:glycosyltransferase family 32 protein n=1 Tax=Sphingomonas sp. OV641 TaxID=1881068 RepID=UPI0008BD4F01|nr:glycosyltransferase [Sphingomonas sp. OV641]SEJ67161.1 Glycosyltransferase sugar-binding region containing DXD motif-containing protein [Sphingomonas sp. OV641]